MLQRIMAAAVLGCAFHAAPAVAAIETTSPVLFSDYEQFGAYYKKTGAMGQFNNAPNSRLTIALEGLMISEGTPNPGLVDDIDPLRVGKGMPFNSCRRVLYSGGASFVGNFMKALYLERMNGSQPGSQKTVDTVNRMTSQIKSVWASGGYADGRDRAGDCSAYAQAFDKVVAKMFESAVAVNSQFLAAASVPQTQSQTPTLAPSVTLPTRPEQEPPFVGALPTEGAATAGQAQQAGGQTAAPTSTAAAEAAQTSPSITAPAVEPAKPTIERQTAAAPAAAPVQPAQSYSESAAQTEGPSMWSQFTDWLGKKVKSIGKTIGNIAHGIIVYTMILLFFSPVIGVVCCFIFKSSDSIVVIENLTDVGVTAAMGILFLIVLGLLIWAFPTYGIYMSVVPFFFFLRFQHMVAKRANITKRGKWCAFTARAMAPFFVLGVLTRGNPSPPQRRSDESSLEFLARYVVEQPRYEENLRRAQENRVWWILLITAVVSYFINSYTLESLSSYLNRRTPYSPGTPSADTADNLAQA